MRNLPGDGVLSSDRVDNFQGNVFFRETLRVNLSSHPERINPPKPYSRATLAWGHGHPPPMYL